ncbi:hypothetical protein FOXB_12314 [Fusarium oxysporum f. sp. conglutinans Fo5176]|uniref:Uncharacterized protein n=1 Tax=Fusarium oxysporum (strain Fo5176) TaxID=660025 RepID=F9G0Y2_FUSOF|nr:hypothetical protein FOXB_12314 [Fusarium oxysporum f. sp. conglutinans Fo5176]
MTTLYNPRKLHPDPSAPVRGVAPFSCFDSRPASPHKPDAYIVWTWYR